MELILLCKGAFIYLLRFIMAYVDSERFKNHHMMAGELELTPEEASNLSEAELVHLYDITFLVNRQDFVEKSRSYRPSGTRLPTGGPYGGQFPYIVHEPKTHSKK
jgi:hypothetical protein